MCVGGGGYVCKEVKMSQNFRTAPRMAPNICGLACVVTENTDQAAARRRRKGEVFVLAPQNAAAAAAAADKLLSLLSLFLFEVLTRLFI